MKKKTATRQFEADKSKSKTVKYGTTPCLLKQKRKVNSKIDEQIKKSLYNWIMHPPQVVQSPIFNDCLEVKIDGRTEPQLVPHCYLGCPSENFITTLLATRTMVDSKNQ